MWVGKGVGLLAGSHIGDVCMIGYGSVTSKKYKKNSNIVGVPAKVIRENIYWKRDVTGFYSLDSLKDIQMQEKRK